MTVRRHQVRLFVAGSTGQRLFAGMPAGVAAAIWLFQINFWWIPVAATFVGYLTMGIVRLGDARPVLHTHTAELAPHSNLPPPPTQNVGREAEADQLRQYLIEGNTRTQRIVVISGVAGIGKTSLALHVAHRVAGQFPAGALFAHLDSDNRRKSVLAARRVFIAALSLAGEPAPTHRWAEWRRYRTLTRSLAATNRMLMVLDDVSRVDDVRPLLPRRRGCAVIITCRTPLSGLECLSVDLRELQPHAAARMLSNIIGKERVHEEDELAREVLKAAAHHPLAIQLIGMALANRPSLQLLVARNRMLPGATQSDVRGTFDNALDLSYAMLTHDEQRALDALGLIERRQFSPWELGELLRQDQREAWLYCDRLTDAGLLERQSTDAVGVQSFRMLEHVESYARQRARRAMSAKDRGAAHARLRQHRQQRTRDPIGTRESQFEQVHSVYQEGRISRAFKDARDAVAHARERKDRAREAEATAMLAELHAELGGLEDVLDLLSFPLKSASLPARARALRLSAKMHRRLRHVDQARKHVADAASLFTSFDDRPEQIRLLRERAIVESIGDTPGQGRQILRDAFKLCGADPQQKAGLGYAYGRVLISVGDLPGAREKLRAGASIAADTGQDLWVAWIAYEQAILALRMGSPADAFRHAEFGIERFWVMRHRYGRAHCRMVMGEVARSEGDLAAADLYFEEALETFGYCGDAWVEADAAAALASVRVDTDPEAAARLLEDAMGWFGSIGAHERMAEARRDLELLRPRLSQAVVGPKEEPR